MTLEEKQSLLDAYKREFMNVKFLKNAIINGYDVDFKEDEAFLKFIELYNNKIFKIYNEKEIDLNITSVQDVIKEAILFIHNLYYGKLDYQTNKLKSIISYFDKDKYYAVTKRKYMNDLSNVEEILLEGRKDGYSSVMLIHELIHALYPFTKNMYFNEALPILHEWLYMDKEYKLFRSMQIFSLTDLNKNMYDELDNKLLVNLFKVGNEFNTDMYTASYICSLMLLDCYYKQPRLFIKKLLELQSNPNIIEELFKFYHIKFNSNKTVDLMKTNYKVLRKEFNSR